MYNNFSVYLQLWYALAKTLSEKAAWALAMDRMLNMVSVNAGLVLGPAVAQQNPQVTMAYLQGINICSLLLHLPHFYFRSYVHNISSSNRGGSNV